MFSPEFLVYHENAQHNATQRQHQFLTVEHLLLQLLDDADVQWILAQCELDLQVVSGALNDYLDEHIPVREGTPNPTKSLKRVL